MMPFKISIVWARFPAFKACIVRGPSHRPETGEAYLEKGILAEVSSVAGKPAIHHVKRVKQPLIRLNKSFLLRGLQSRV